MLAFAFIVMQLQLTEMFAFVFIYGFYINTLLAISYCHHQHHHHHNNFESALHQYIVVTINSIFESIFNGIKHLKAFHSTVAMTHFNSIYFWLGFGFVSVLLPFWFVYLKLIIIIVQFTIKVKRCHSLMLRIVG